MHKWVCCHYEAANYQLPIAAAFWIIQIVSTEEGSSLMQNLMQIHYSTCLVILNMRATQYRCSLNVIHHPHWLVQWSCHCSCMHFPVHCPWLPGYIDVTQTVLVINDDWTSSEQTSYIMEHYSAITKDKILPFVTTWMDFENIKQGTLWLYSYVG